jgi:hypothetical protein
VDWLITLSGAPEDVAVLLSQKIEQLAEIPADPDKLLLTLSYPEGGESGGDYFARVDIEAFVDRLNGMGSLRWGRGFKGVSISGVKSVDASGEFRTIIFAKSAAAHLHPRDFADTVERFGFERPDLPDGVEIVESLDFAALMKRAGQKPEAIRVLHLIDRMLHANDQIDWAAGYAAVETVEHDLRSRELDGRDLGWWTKSEMNDFKATANSPEVLGALARHGKPSRLTELRMTPQKANWFVRRIVVLWLTSLSA